MNLRWITFCFALIGAQGAMAQTADEILAKTDAVRNPAESYQMEVSVESPDKPKFAFQIFIGGKEASLIRTQEPKREVGKNYLMEGADMWAYLPNLRRAVRVSLNQKLTGQASNGDISRMRWHGDYTAAIESEDDKQWVLFLTAGRERLTYDKIRVFVDKQTFRPIKADYLTRSGQAIKHAHFEEFAEMAGGERPVLIRIVDAKDASNYSILRIHAMEKKTMPASFFKQQNLRS